MSTPDEEAENEDIELAAMGAEMYGNLGFVPTADQLRQVRDENPLMTALARVWGWGDTEIREQLCAALEKLNQTAGGHGR